MSATLELPSHCIDSWDCQNQPAEAFTGPLIAMLGQLGDVVDRLSNAQYTRKPVGVVESSVGGHVRHCLDHVRALLNSIETGELDYDRRSRGTAVEMDRAAAIEESESLVAGLRAVDGEALGQMVRMSVLMTSDGQPLQVISTIGREMAYTLCHTIHHNALVGAMVKTLKGWLPEQFGYAPSTIRNRIEPSSCRT